MVNILLKIYEQRIRAVGRMEKSQIRTRNENKNIFSEVIPIHQIFLSMYMLGKDERNIGRVFGE